MTWIPWFCRGASISSAQTSRGGTFWSRMIHGSRVSIFIGFIAVFIYVAIGIIIGSIAGYYGGWIDIVISRFIEIIMCFPLFPDTDHSGPVGAEPDERHGGHRHNQLARHCPDRPGRVHEATGMDFVIASRAVGARDTWIIVRHILPNSLAPVLVSATFGIASTILIESSLSFLGFGVQPPTPSWRYTLAVEGLHGFRLVAYLHPRFRHFHHHHGI